MWYVLSVLLSSVHSMHAVPWRPGKGIRTSGTQMGVGTEPRSSSRAASALKHLSHLSSLFWLFEVRFYCMTHAGPEQSLVNLLRAGMADMHCRG